MLPEAGQEKTEKFHLTCDLISIGFEPVGRWFEAYLRRQKREKSASISSNPSDDSEQINDDDDVDNFQLTEDERAFLLSLDSKEWKKQDHYRVLRVKDRFAATEEAIKKAYRKMVLQHHPDKKSSRKSSFEVPGLNEHEYFTCITKAYEILSNATTRRAYDSVDPTFNEDIPTSVKGDFFETFKPVFSINSRWSVKNKGLDLGDMDSSEDYVNEFYAFWYDFDSWREFSYLDEEDKGMAESREERRWMEKQNRRKRQSRKKEELARIRLLVDTAYANDPRIKKFAEERKQRKLQDKKAKEEAVKEKERLRLEAEEAARRAREKTEQEAKEKALKEKKEREKVKKAVAKEKKFLRNSFKEKDYFVEGNVDLVTELNNLERTLENLSLENLQEMHSLYESNNIDELRKTYRKHVESMIEQARIAEEKMKDEKARQLAAQHKDSSQSANRPWSETEIQLLVKASVLFPPGTASRWQVIANYINEHSGEAQNRTSKQVISKAKALQQMDQSVKDEANKRAFEKLKKETSAKVVVQPAGGVSLRDESQPTPEVPWTSEEQKLLEQALKTFPASTSERWDRIAEAVSTRSRKECMKRYKELVEMVKAKKSAQAQTVQSAQR